MNIYLPPPHRDPLPVRIFCWAVIAVVCTGFVFLSILLMWEISAFTD